MQNHDTELDFMQNHDTESERFNNTSEMIKLGPPFLLQIKLYLQYIKYFMY
jgi:hypothetical protein